MCLLGVPGQKATALIVIVQNKFPSPNVAGTQGETLFARSAVTAQVIGPMLLLPPSRSCTEDRGGGSEGEGGGAGPHVATGRL